MNPNWCAFCAREIPGDRLACDKCRPLVKKLGRKSRRIFEREEKRLKDLAELLARIESLKKKSIQLKEQTIEYLRKFVEKSKKEAPNDEPPT